MGPMDAVTLGPSPLAGLPGAVVNPTDSTAGSHDIDAGMVWHFGDPFGEQAAAAFSPILLDRWTSEHIIVSGPQSLEWLQLLGTQHFLQLTNGGATESLWLSPRGQIRHWADVAVLDGEVHLRCEPGSATALIDYLQLQIFRYEVTVRDASADFASLSVVGHGAFEGVETALGMTCPEIGQATLVPPPLVMGKIASGGWLRSYPGRVDIVVPRRAVSAVVQALREVDVRPAGSWAAAALRIPARRPRFGVDNDERTLPHETNWLGTAVHMKKGCYPGQETVAKIANVGAPPRRIVVLNLDGSGGTLPDTGDDVTTADGKKVGRLGTIAQHFEEGPIALALMKRTIDSEVPLLVGHVDARVDPDDKTIVRRLVKTPEFFNFNRR